MKYVLGYIPAGGSGSRMNDFGITKEMLPHYSLESGEMQLVIDHAIECFETVNNCNLLVTVNTEKNELLKHLNKQCNKKRYKFIV